MVCEEGERISALRKFRATGVRLEAGSWLALFNCILSSCKGLGLRLWTVSCKVMRGDWECFLL